LELDIGPREVAMSLVRILGDVIAISHANFHEGFGEPRNKVSLEGTCTVRAEQVVLSLSIVSVYLSSPNINMNVTRPVSPRDFDEHPRLKVLAISNFAALLKVESEVPDVRVCRQSNLDESVSSSFSSSSRSGVEDIYLDRALVGVFVRRIRIAA
jgi:hypothetical protein